MLSLIARECPDMIFSWGDKDPKEVVRSMRDLPITKELRTTFQYCNIMFIAVSHVIEVLTGMWLGDFLRTRIWEPLGIKSTFFSLDDAQKHIRKQGITKLARGYWWNNET